MEDALINDILSGLGLNRRDGRLRSISDDKEEEPDFGLDEDCGLIIGENKKPNKIEEGVTELKQDYLRVDIWPNYGIATDGFEFVLIRREQGGDFTENQEVRRYSLREAIKEKARQRGIISQSRIGETSVEEEIGGLVDILRPEKIVPLLTEEAPKELREKRSENVEDFYELYVEIIFGDSDKIEGEYETCLTNGIRAPEGATEKEEDIFAVELVNRLMFVKFLEKHGVISEGFLSDRVQEYDEGSLLTLYEAKIKPLFYRVLNTPEEDRKPEVKGEPYDEIPYLNGGLFRPTLEREEEYDVETPIMEKAVRELVEGQSLEFEVNPAILGAVFEKAINHLGAEENRQKDMGAYYTPNDVTQKITKETIDQKLKESIIEGFADHVDQEKTFREEVSQERLDDLLKQVEGESFWFQSKQGYEEVEERIKDIRVLDPACGSGHFLTSAMERIYQVNASIRRGSKGGSQLSEKEKYEIKKSIALNSIYGVDVDAVAIEIAKLRVWLKIVEGNSWQEDFSQLPNIDVNIVAGNSLIGLPVKGKGQFTLEDFDVDFSEVEKLRKNYKNEQISRQELRNRIEERQSDLTGRFLSKLNHYVEDEINSREEFRNIAGSGDLFPKFRKITVRKRDGTALSEEQKQQLSQKGFNVEPRQGKSAKVTGEDIRDFSKSQISPLLDEFKLETERKVTKYDLEKIELAEDASFGAFHWIVQFPETVKNRDSENPEVKFDVIIGNPPYGNVLSDTEKALVGTYGTCAENEISSQFIERQLQLLAEGGRFGNVTTTALLKNSNLSKVRQILQKKCSALESKSFARRPSSIFSNAEINVAITTARKDSQNPAAWETSDFIRFNSENRSQALKNIETSPIKGLILGDSLGSTRNSENYMVYPSVGSETKRSILSKLANEENKLGDLLEEEGHLIQYRRSGDYWMNVSIEELPQSKNMIDIHFESEIMRDFCFLAMNSSLFYLYWFTFCNMHDVTKSQVKRFPIPDKEVIMQNSDQIDSLKEKLWSEIMSNYHPQDYHQFVLPPVKDTIDEVDEFLGQLYELSEKEVSFVTDYHTEFGRKSSTPV